MQAAALKQESPTSISGGSVQLYAVKGQADPYEINYVIDAKGNQILNLTVLLAENADNKRIWYADIRKLICDGVPDVGLVERCFSGLRKLISL